MGQLIPTACPSFILWTYSSFVACTTRSTRASKGEAFTILASVSSGIGAVWTNREKRAWTIVERYDCLVVHLTSYCQAKKVHLVK